MGNRPVSLTEGPVKNILCIGGRECRGFRPRKMRQVETVGGCWQIQLPRIVAQGTMEIKNRIEFVRSAFFCLQSYLWSRGHTNHCAFIRSSFRNVHLRNVSSSNMSNLCYAWTNRLFILWKHGLSFLIKFLPFSVGSKNIIHAWIILPMSSLYPQTFRTM